MTATATRPARRSSREEAPVSAPRGLPPGPRGIRSLLFLRRFVRDALPAVAEGYALYGDVFYARLGPSGMLFVRRPEHVQRVLVDHHTRYARSIFYDRLKLVLGEGLFTADGAPWLRQRRLMQPSFQPKQLERAAEAFTLETRRLLDEWADGETVDLHRAMAALTLRIAGRVLFHVDLAADAAEFGRSLDIVLHHMNERASAFFVLPDWVPTPANLSLKRHNRVLEALVWRILKERRAQAPDERPKDLLSTLLEARDDDGSGLDDRQVRDEVMTLLIAGHETTANLLTHALVEVARLPHVEARLLEEVDRVLGGREPGYADIDRLVYTKQVLDETLRLHPPAWMMDRAVVEEDELGGYLVPKGTVVGLSLSFTQRLPDLWPHPARFDPDRFEPARRREIPRFAFYPFGGGPRQCIGNRFAEIEATLCLAMIAQRYRLRVTPELDFTLKPAITLRPANPLPVRTWQR